MADLRDFLEGTPGKVAAIVVVLLGVAAAIYAFKSNTNPAAIANERVFIDATTGKPYNQDLKAGMDIPARAPSGGNTGYPAELCYWTADGKPKDQPTPVLLNLWVGKPGPTFCPDCKRLVVAHNPRAGAGMRPPPTEAEYKAKHKDSSPQTDR